LAQEQRWTGEAVLGSHFTDSSFLASAANEHNNRADNSNEESRRTEHRGNYTQSFIYRTLDQILERIRACWVLDNRIRYDTYDNEKNKPKHSRQ
jgi:hypothetical protein